ncbi:MAG: hypothetical protein ACM3SR_14320 [Ignavibacteriales bacterium]
MTNLKGKEIAEKVGISHVQLRKWKNEKPFQEKVMSNEQEFASEFLQYLRDKSLMILNLAKVWNEGRRTGIISEQLEKGRIPFLTLSEIDDLKFYHPQLAFKIAKLISNTKGDKFKSFPYFRGIVCYVLHSFEASAKIEIKWPRDYKETLRRDIDRGIQKLIEKPALSEQERDEIIALLFTLKTFTR